MKSFPADINVVGYMKLFKDKCNEKKTEIAIKLSACIADIDRLKKLIETCIDDVNRKCNIDFRNTEEYINKKTSKDSNIKSIITNFTFNSVGEERNKLLLVIKYLTTLEEYNAYTEKYNYYNKLSAINRKEYNNILKKYYGYGVGKCMIEGYAYKFSCRFGYLLFVTYKNGAKQYLDFGKTDAKKKEIIAAGYELKKNFSDPNDKGIDYRVYRRTEVHRMIEIISTPTMSARMFAATVAKFIGSGTIESLAKTCKNLEDVYNLEQPIGIKASVAEIVSPGINLKYTRSLGQKKSNIETLRKIKYKNE